MTEPQTGRATDDDRVGAEQQSKQVQDASTDPLTPVRMAQLAGLTTALAVGLYLLREFLFGRKQKTRSELIAEAAKARAEIALAKSEAGRKAARKAAKNAAKQAGPAAEKARKAAAKASKSAKPVALAGAGAVAATAGKVGTEVAARAVEVGSEVAAKAVDVGSEVAARAAELGAGVGAGVVSIASEIGDEVGDTVHGVQKKVRKTRRRLFVLICLGIGYVLGARAGRERYDQIVAQAQKLAGRPEVEQARHKVAEKLDEATGHSSDGSSSSTTTV